MIKKVEFEVLDFSSNAVVARSPDRNFPGVLLQGDTLRILLDDLVELRELVKKRDYASADDASNDIEERIRELLRHYEAALRAHGIELPYSKPVSEETT